MKQTETINLAPDLAEVLQRAESTIRRLTRDTETCDLDHGTELTLEAIQAVLTKAGVISNPHPNHKPSPETILATKKGNVNEHD